MTPKIKIIVFVLLLAFIAGLAVLHTVTPGHLILYHDTYRRLSYFPIAIGAVFFGVWGGLAFAVISSVGFIPHLYTFWAAGPDAYYSELSEILFYLAAGLVIGLISSRENRLREKYKTLSEKLADSYQRLHEQATQLVAAEKQLGESQKLSLLGRVSASLAHEIKNPLAAIKGAAEILADEVPAHHPKHEFVEIMKAETNRLNQSVEDVLKFCRGKQLRETGKKEQISKILKRLSVLFETSFKEKEIELSIEIGPAARDMVADETAMHQVLMNIVINAVDAIGKKGCIQIKADAGEKEYRILISDDGPGIDPGKYQEIFHSFVTYKEGGTGLGLSISKRIVESMGGTIEIDKSDLGGACFIVRLPLAPYSGSEGV